MQFWFEKHRSDTWDPKGMFSAPSGRSDNNPLDKIYITRSAKIEFVSCQKISYKTILNKCLSVKATDPQWGESQIIAK